MSQTVYHRQTRADIVHMSGTLNPQIFTFI